MKTLRYIYRELPLGLLEAAVIFVLSMAFAFADSPPTAEKLPASTNPQVRSVVERMGGRIVGLEERQAKQDEILTVQAQSLVVVNKAIDQQTDFLGTVTKENEGLRANLKATQEDLKEARKRKWTFALVLGAIFGVAGIGFGYLFGNVGGSGATVRVESAPAPPAAAQPESPLAAPEQPSLEERQEYEKSAAQATRKAPTKRQRR